MHRHSVLGDRFLCINSAGGHREHCVERFPGLHLDLMAQDSGYLSHMHVIPDGNTEERWSSYFL